jgi:hypothetical protein
MEAVKAYYDGHAFVPMFPVNVAKDRLAIVTILDNVVKDDSQKNYLQYAGKLSNDTYQELTAILQDTRKIDKDGW